MDGGLRKRGGILKAGLRGASEAKEACTLQQFNAPGNRNWTGAAVDLEGEVRCFLYFLWLKDAKVENGSLRSLTFPVLLKGYGGVVIIFVILISGSVCLGRAIDHKGHALVLVKLALGNLKGKKKGQQNKTKQKLR